LLPAYPWGSCVEKAILKSWYEPTASFDQAECQLEKSTRVTATLELW
jgi:hypothetical protein